MAWLPHGEKISKICLFVLDRTHDTGAPEETYQSTVTQRLQSVATYKWRPITNYSPTDRQMDTACRHIPRLCIASHGKNRRFHVPQPTFLFPLETPLLLSRNMFHRWKDNSILAKPLAACTYLSSIVSELYDAQVNA